MLFVHINITDFLENIKHSFVVFVGLFFKRGSVLDTRVRMEKENIL